MPCWQVVIMSSWNFPVTTTDEPSGVVTVSTPIRLASTVPLSSVSTTQPDSTPASRVPRSWETVPPACAELGTKDSLAGGAMGTDVGGGGVPVTEGAGPAEVVASADAVKALEALEAVDDTAAEDPPDGAGVLGSLEPHAVTPATQVSRAAAVSARRRDPVGFCVTLSPLVLVLLRPVTR